MITQIKKAKKLTPTQKKAVYLANQARAKGGFPTFGEYAKAVYGSGFNGAMADRIRNSGPTSVSTEGTGTEGGFLVPPEYATDLGKSIVNQSLLKYTDRHFASQTNRFQLPVDRSTPWDSTNGIRVTWEGETNQLAQSKPLLGLETLHLNKLTALCPVSDDLLEDASALDAYLRRKVAEKMAFKIALAIIQGSGAGEPLGFLNSPALISVEKESGQAADTIQAENIVNMVSRMYGLYFMNSVWLASESVLPQLLTLSFEGKTSSVPLAGLTTDAKGQLRFFGRPLILTQACEMLGDSGDIILADLSQYLTVLKDEIAERKISMHLWFDYTVTAFKVAMRIGGHSWLPSAMSPRDGSITLSAFIALAERS